jgi:hypothetical protein
MSKKKGGDKKRGPKGGIKHQPGKGHDSKSGPIKKKRYIEKAEKKRQRKIEEARKKWAEWDQLNDDQKKLLAKFKPRMPRPEP